MNHVYLSLGSNTQPEQHLPKAVGLLRDRCDVIFGVTPSRVYQSADTSGTTDSAPYCNAALRVDTELSATALKERVLSTIEAALGRTRENRAVVTIDLDIVLFNQEQFTLGKRVIPDPAILQHAFVAIPLAEIAGDLLHPVTREPLRDIAARFDSSLLRLREDIHLGLV